MNKELLVTGSNGLTGSKVVSFFASKDWNAFGINNNMRADFFGPRADTLWNHKRLTKNFPNFKHKQLDFGDPINPCSFVKEIKPANMNQSKHSKDLKNIFQKIHTSRLKREIIFS